MNIDYLWLVECLNSKAPQAIVDAMVYDTLKDIPDDVELNAKQVFALCLEKNPPCEDPTIEEARKILVAKKIIELNTILHTMRNN